MNRFIVFIVLSICFICIFGSNASGDFNKSSPLSIQTSLREAENSRRKTGHYFLYPYHGWYALSWIYWIKVKLIVIAFFVGTAFIWAIQYIGKFYHQCPSTEHLHYAQYRFMDDPTIARFLQGLPEQVSFNK